MKAGIMRRAERTEVESWGRSFEGVAPGQPRRGVFGAERGACGTLDPEPIATGEPGSVRAGCAPNINTAADYASAPGAHATGLAFSSGAALPRAASAPRSAPKTPRRG